jgi:hypothetical protein
LFFKQNFLKIKRKRENTRDSKMSDLEEEFEEELEEDEGEVGEIEELGDDELPSKALKRTHSFDVLPEKKVINSAQETIQYVMQVCAIPTVSAATLLLRSFKWNKDKLVESYLENAQAVCKKSWHVHARSGKNSSEPCSDSRMFDLFDRLPSFTDVCPQLWASIL